MTGKNKNQLSIRKKNILLILKHLTFLNNKEKNHFVHFACYSCISQFIKNILIFIQTR